MLHSYNFGLFLSHDLRLSSPKREKDFISKDVHQSVNPHPPLFFIYAWNHPQGDRLYLKGTVASDLFCECFLGNQVSSGP